LRIALVHDWLTGMRGGEKVLEALCECFPKAPLQTLLYVPGALSKIITDREIRTTILQYLPFAASHYRHYLPLFPVFAESSRVADADIVISTSHAVAKSMVRRNAQGRPIHICYIHTPMRYIWDRYDDYFGVNRVGMFRSRFLYAPMARLLQQYDVMTVSRVDKFVANSHFVADRVKRLYGRTAAVLPPPVDVERFSSVLRRPEEWYLMVTALVPYKNVHHAIQACALQRRPLTIVGTGPEEKSLRALAQSLNAAV
jgi:glycosyltransferase involved in cell wall biosynthesis